MFIYKKLLYLSITLLIAGLCTVANALEVSITRTLQSIDVIHRGEKITIMRNQNLGNKIITDYAKTSRKCPPFCVQAIKIADGVETIGELEMLAYLKSMNENDASVLVIDSRTPDWFAKGTIPSATNIPWTLLSQSAGADPFLIAEILEKKFNVKLTEWLWDFSAAKTLVLFCNGNWCGQSPNNIKSLLKLGYPAQKLKWYRGGMQSWHSLGLTVVK